MVCAVKGVCRQVGQVGRWGRGEVGKIGEGVVGWVGYLEVLNAGDLDRGATNHHEEASGDANVFLLGR